MIINGIYAFLRKSKKQTVLAVFNLSDYILKNYKVKLKGFATAQILIDSDWECFGGTTRKKHILKNSNGILQLHVKPFSGQLFILQ
ncbi:MAG: alpha amylase C-terminal domain-containing protein [Candidatus Gastranaerophilales bacterium]|nr:alpha amylase C-terminal domain-containing protein [Candidatus Gastranaerophilales bacterium]